MARILLSRRGTMDFEHDPLRRRFTLPPPIETPDEGPRSEATGAGPATSGVSPACDTSPGPRDEHAPATTTNPFADVKLSGSPDYQVERLGSTLDALERRALEHAVQKAITRGSASQLEKSARALLRFLEKRDPEPHAAISKALLLLGEAELAQGKLVAARDTLQRAHPDDLESDALRGRQRAMLRRIEQLQVRVALREAQELKFKEELGAIALLTNDPSPEARTRAVARAEAFLEKTRRVAPSATEAVEAVEYLVAFAKLQAGDERGALATFEALAAPPRTTKIAERARAMITALQASELDLVAEKARLEQVELEALRAEKLPDSKLALLNPAQVYSLVTGGYDDLSKRHEAALDRLGELQTGAKVAATVMRRKGLTLAQLRALPDAELAALAGRQGARAIRELLKLSDVKHLEAGSAALTKRTWNATPPETYVDRDYLDLRFDAFARGLGDFLRRTHADALRATRSTDAITAGAAKYSVAVLDATTWWNELVDDGLKNAREFYLPTGNDGVTSYAGKAIVFAVDAVGAIATMPTKLVDPKVSDTQRAVAIEDAVIGLASGGLSKALPRAKPHVARALAGTTSQKLLASSFGRRLVTAAKYEPFAALSARLSQPVFARAATRADDAVPATRAATRADDAIIVARRAPPPSPAMGVDDFVDAALERPMESLSDLRALGPEQLADDLYGDVYARARAPKVAILSQEEYLVSLLKLPHGDGVGGGWIYFQTERFAKNGLKRFYLNLLPDHAARFSAKLFEALDATQVPYRFKVPHETRGFSRADTGVLWVAEEHEAVAEAIVARLAREAPDALDGGIPPMTRPVTRGVGAADEPLHDHFDVRQSFGGSRCHIVAEGICHAPQGASRTAVRESVRRNFKEYGIDPDTPWANDSWSEPTRERVVSELAAELAVQ